MAFPCEVRVKHRVISGSWVDSRSVTGGQTWGWDSRSSRIHSVADSIKVEKLISHMEVGDEMGEQGCERTRPSTYHLSRWEVSETDWRWLCLSSFICMRSWNSHLFIDFLFVLERDQSSICLFLGRGFIHDVLPCMMAVTVILSGVPRSPWHDIPYSTPFFFQISLAFLESCVCTTTPLCHVIHLQVLHLSSSSADSMQIVP